MKDVILFCAGGFAGMAIIPIGQIIFELLYFEVEDMKEKATQPRDNEEVSIIAGDKYYE